MSLKPEALERLIEIARESNDPTIIGSGKGRILFTKEGKFEIPPEPVKQGRKIHTFESFQRIVAVELSSTVAGKKPAKEDANGVFRVPNEGSCVYVSDKRFVYLSDPSDPYGFEAVFFPVPSVEAMWFSAESKNAMDQKILIRTLRITLSRCLLSKDIVSLIRNVKFKADTSGESDLQHGRQSISRSIIKEVKGLDTIPETLTIQIKPFENINIIKRVQIAIEIDENTETFKLTPLPGEWDRMIDEVLNECVASVMQANERVLALRGDA